MTERFSVQTRSRSDFIDITAQIRNIVAKSGVSEGICHIFVPHTTAGVTINENADPDVTFDMKNALDKLIPWTDGYHHFEGNSAAHIKASLMGFSATVPIDNESLVFGTWQCIYFCEFDGPRTRSVVVTVTKA